MSTLIKLKRGQSAAVDAYIPAAGEPVWDLESKKLYIGDGNTTRGFIVGGGVGGGGGGLNYDGAQDVIESNMYGFLFNASRYENMTYDILNDTSLINSSTTTMLYDVTNTEFDFDPGEIVESKNLFDSISGLTNITECVVVIDYIDSSTPIVEVTADGTNWEVATLNQPHIFTNVGTDLRIRFTGGGTGSVRSWSVLYNPLPDGGVIGPGSGGVGSNKKYITFSYEGIAQLNDNIINGFLFDETVNIGKISIHSRIVPIGSPLTVDILKNNTEQLDLVSLPDGQNYVKTTLGTPLNFTNADSLGIRFKSIGSGVPGEGISVVLHYSIV